MGATRVLTTGTDNSLQHFNYKPWRGGAAHRPAQPSAHQHPESKSGVCGTGCAGGAFGALGPLARAAGGGAGVGEAVPSSKINCTNMWCKIPAKLWKRELLCFALGRLKTNCF